MNSKADLRGACKEGVRLEQAAKEEFGFAVKKKWGRGASPGFDGRGRKLRGGIECRIFM